MSDADARVLPLLQRADKNQAQYFLDMLDARRTEIDEQLSLLPAALAEAVGRGDSTGIAHLRQAITDKCREVSEIDDLITSLVSRFFARAPRVRPQTK
jgi:hypothetical protein